jgi:hypothetical protein
MWERVTRFVRRKFNVWGACVALGAGYGAAFCAICGTLRCPVFGTVIGTLGGAMYGSVCGCVAGIAGNVVGGRIGWGLAGLLGGLTPLAIIWPWLQTGQNLSMSVPGMLIVFLPPAVLGLGLGLSVGCAIRTGRSSIPGVDGLIKAIHDDGRPWDAKLWSLPTEVVPTATPEGRGDEVAPAG